MNQKPFTYSQTDLKAVGFNLNQIARLASRNTFSIPTRDALKDKIVSYPMEILAVVKANAYGHGVKYVAPFLQEQGVKLFGVSDVREGIELRKLGIKGDILLFESTLPEQAEDIITYDLMPSLCTLALAKRLNSLAVKLNKKVKVHVHVDTGMGRLGIWHDEALGFVRSLMKLTRLSILGIYTHFPVADTNRKATEKQIQHLYNLVLTLDRQGLIIPYIHASNSMGLAGYETRILNIVRPGLMLYGLYPQNSLCTKFNLKPALSVKSKVIFVKDLPKGQGISYGWTFRTKKATRIAVIPIGYNDGYFRNLSNKAAVLIDGQRCPVVGNVTMDQIIVDVTHLKRVRLGQQVVILGKQKNEKISADELAKHVKTINYEIVCELGNRLGE